jgi:hypothetical protein
MYFKPETGEIFTAHSEIRASMPNVIFPAIVTDEDLAYAQVYPLAYERPEVGADQIAEPVAVENVDGVWTQMWNVRAATQEELDARAAAAKALVPQQVTRRQARQALLLNGLLDQVPTKIALISDPTERGLAQIEWEDSQVFERNRPLLISIGTAIGLDSDGLDALFTQATGL